MNEVPRENKTTIPPHLLRFSVRHPLLDEAIASFEQRDDDSIDELPRHLFLYAQHRIITDSSDTIDGYSRNVSATQQYQVMIQNVSRRGRKEFKLMSDHVRAIRSNEDSAQITGLDLRLKLDPIDNQRIKVAPLTNALLSKEALKAAQSVPHLPVFYKVERPIDNAEVAFDRLTQVVRLGVYVSELTMVPMLPKGARERDIFHTPPLVRTFDKIDTWLK